MKRLFFFFLLVPIFAHSMEDPMEPHMVLELNQKLNDEQIKCLHSSETRIIRYCYDGSREQANLEVFLRRSYRGEEIPFAPFIPIPDDRDERLRESYQMITQVCGTDLNLNEDEFSSIVGTPLASLGTPERQALAKQVLEHSAQHFYGMSLQDTVTFSSRKEIGGKKLMEKLTIRGDCDDDFIGM